MNAAEFEKALEDFSSTDDYYDQDWEVYGGPIWEELFNLSQGMTKNVPGLGDITVEDMGGAEGDGAEQWVVVRFGEQLFMKSGYYSSYSESTWDGACREVESYEKTVTDYRPV